MYILVTPVETFGFHHVYKKFLTQISLALAHETRKEWQNEKKAKTSYEKLTMALKNVMVLQY